MAAIEIAAGRRVQYDVSGPEGAPVILLIAGLGASRQFWFPVVEEFAKTHRVVTFDNRDAGESEPETAPYSMGDMADDAAGLLQALGVEMAHVVGISMGGFISQHLAVRHPEVVDHLVLVGTGPAAGKALNNPLAPPKPEDWIADPVERNRQRMPQNCAPGYFDTRQEQLETTSQRYRDNRMSLDGYSRQIQAISETHDVRDRLKDISAPTLVIHGAVDPTVPLRGGELIAEGVPGARLLVYPGVGHLPPHEVTDQFIADVLAFLGDG
jgi:pimeloyl-ACP methyl ester carboxylesterase